MKLFEATKIPVLHRALDAYALRQKVIAGNLANITTAGYRAKTVEFEEHLSAAMRTSGGNSGVTHEGHIPLVGDPTSAAQARVVDSAAPTVAGDDPQSNGINNVDLDSEMAELAKNQLRFKFSARLITDAFRGIQKSIRGTV